MKTELARPGELVGYYVQDYEALLMSPAVIHAVSSSGQVSLRPLLPVGTLPPGGLIEEVPWGPALTRRVGDAFWFHLAPSRDGRLFRDTWRARL